MEINVDLMSVVYAFMTLGVYTTVVCVFFYLRSEKSIDKQDKLITEWRDEHRAQINKMETVIEKNEGHWREMFTHFNNRFDKIHDKG
jgi:hypothetical protein